MPPKKKTTNKENTVATKKLARQKVKLKVTPQQAAQEAAKSLKNRGIESVMVFGLDDFTMEFLGEGMKKGLQQICFSDDNVHNASTMQKELARFNNSMNVAYHVHHVTALEEVWAEVLVLGKKDTALEYKKRVGELPYDQVIVLEDF